MLPDTALPVPTLSLQATPPPKELVEGTQVRVGTVG